MDKKIIFSTILVSIIILIFAYILIGSSTKKQLEKENTFSPPKDEIVFYYGNTCPHCADVERWMRENKVEEKLKIIKKEIYQNQANAQELDYVAQSCGLNPQRIGVPFLYADGKCYLGSDEVERIIKEKAGIN